VQLEGIDGDQVISVPIEQARQIGNLPADVQIIRLIDPPENHEWLHPQCLFLHIRHRLCFRHSPGSALCIEKLADFIDRYAELTMSGK
jgi:hypothetical protein